MNKGVCLASYSGYGWIGKDPFSLQEYIQHAVDRFEHVVPEMPDAIAFTGSSGAAIAFPLAAKYRLPLIMVRKDHEKSHGYKVDCNYSGVIKNYIIVDDFVATGASVRRILAKIIRRARYLEKTPPVCTGIYLWCDGHAGSRTFGRNIIPMYIPDYPDNKSEE